MNYGKTPPITRVPIQSNGLRIEINLERKQKVENGATTYTFSDGDRDYNLVDGLVIFRAHRDDIRYMAQVFRCDNGWELQILDNNNNQIVQTHAYLDPTLPSVATEDAKSIIMAIRPQDKSSNQPGVSGMTFGVTSGRPGLFHEIPLKRTRTDIYNDTENTKRATAPETLPIKFHDIMLEVAPLLNKISEDAIGKKSKNKPSSLLEDSGDSIREVTQLKHGQNNGQNTPFTPNPSEVMPEEAKSSIKGSKTPSQKDIIFLSSLRSEAHSKIDNEDSKVPLSRNSDRTVKSIPLQFDAESKQNMQVEMQVEMQPDKEEILPPIITPKVNKNTNQNQPREKVVTLPTRRKSVDNMQCRLFFGAKSDKDAFGRLREINMNLGRQSPTGHEREDHSTGKGILPCSISNRHRVIGRNETAECQRRFQDLVYQTKDKRNNKVTFVGFPSHLTQSTSTAELGVRPTSPFQGTSTSPNRQTEGKKVGHNIGDSARNKVGNQYTRQYKAEGKPVVSAIFSQDRKFDIDYGQLDIMMPLDYGHQGRGAKTARFKSNTKTSSPPAKR